LPLRLNVITASTRPGRVGPAVARWVLDHARAHGAFDAHPVDLADFGLPVYDEPKHPRLKDYAHDHTRRWSDSVDSADAFVFVTPEYNSSPTPALLNALDFVYREWNYKPAAFVSYGGISGGLRAVEATKHVLAMLKLMAIPEGVPLPLVSQQTENGVFKPKEINEKGADTMLAELLRWAEALKPMRA
jgi:NAD(P)H-dependent FMN reductase